MLIYHPAINRLLLIGVPKWLVYKSNLVVISEWAICVPDVGEYITELLIVVVAGQKC